MAVVVFDADVLIAYLSRDDASHLAALERVRAALAPGTRRLLSAVNYSELLIGPLRRIGADGAAIVDAALAGLGIEIVAVDRDLARRGAVIRRQTGLKLPDAYALATAALAEPAVVGGVRVESFDRRVVRAGARL